jgi:hypothetical protein
MSTDAGGIIWKKNGKKPPSKIDIPLPTKKGRQSDYGETKTNTSLGFLGTGLKTQFVLLS